MHLNTRLFSERPLYPFLHHVRPWPLGPTLIIKDCVRFRNWLQHSARARANLLQFFFIKSWSRSVCIMQKMQPRLKKGNEREREQEKEKKVGTTLISSTRMQSKVRPLVYLKPLWASKDGEFFLLGARKEAKMFFLNYCVLSLFCLKLLS